MFSQQILLPVVNTSFGRKWLGVDDAKFHSLKAVQIGANHVAFLKGITPDGQLELVARFFCGKDKVKGKFEKLATISSGIALGLLGSPGMPLMALTSFPVGTGDGYVAFDTGTVLWTSARDPATGTVADSTATTAFVASDLSAARYYNYRGYFPANTAAITAAGTVTALVFNYFQFTWSGGKTRTHNLIQTSQASTTTLATSDYSLVTFVGGGNNTVTATGAKTITGNGTSLGWVNKTGVSKIGLITGNDLSNSAPTDDGGNQSIYTSEGTTPPTYDITYTVPGGFMTFLL